MVTRTVRQRLTGIGVAINNMGVILVAYAFTKGDGWLGTCLLLLGVVLMAFGLNWLALAILRQGEGLDD
jgi:hypothetical protein